MYYILESVSLRTGSRGEAAAANPNKEHGFRGGGTRIRRLGLASATEQVQVHPELHGTRFQKKQNKKVVERGINENMHTETP